jgi:hypothetical protein
MFLGEILYCLNKLSFFIRYYINIILQTFYNYFLINIKTKEYPEMNFDNMKIYFFFIGNYLKQKGIVPDEEMMSVLSSFFGNKIIEERDKRIVKFKDVKNIDQNTIKEEKDEKNENKNNNNDNLCIKDPNEKNVDDIQISVKLTRAIDKKYNGVKIDIIPLIKEYIELAIRYGNMFGNTKFVVLSILKTHKKEMEIFQKIQTFKYYDDLIKLFDMEEIYNKLLKENPTLGKYLKTNPENNNENDDKKIK